MDATTQPSPQSAVTHLRRPLLVTGAPRSGTSWVGQVICESGPYRLLFEPFNPDPFETMRIWTKTAKNPFQQYFTYVNSENESRYIDPLRRLLEGNHHLWRTLAPVRSPSELRKALSSYRRSRRPRKNPPLVKDPFALLSAEWLASQFDMSVLITIRHPAAFVGSLKRLKWVFSAKELLLGQPALMRDWLMPLSDELNAFTADESDVVAHGAMLWKALYFVVARYTEQHPDWIFVRHEDVSADPMTVFERLYARLGFDMDDRMRGIVNKYSSEANPTHASGKDRPILLNSKANLHAWKKHMTSEELTQIRKRVEPVSSQFYADEDW